MSTELDTRIWNTDGTVVDRFKKALVSIENIFGASFQIKNFSIARFAPGNIEFDSNQFMRSIELNEVLERLEAPEFTKLTAYFSIPIWRFEGLTPIEGNIMAILSYWGNEYGKTINFDQKIEGTAQLSILSAGPFCAILGGDTNADRVNQCVQDNIDLYLNVLQKLISDTEPEMVLTFTDVGEYTLTNAHLAYFQDASTISSHLLQFISQNKSVKLQKTGSSFHIEGVKESWFFHNWRSESMRAELKQNLDTAFKMKAPRSYEKALEGVLNSGKYDFFDRGSGFIVLNYPYFLNDFLDAFCIDVLKYDAS